MIVNRVPYVTNHNYFKEICEFVEKGAILASERRYFLTEFLMVKYYVYSK